MLSINYKYALDWKIKMSEDNSELREHIGVRAYYLWLSEGCLSGLEEDYWRLAESHEHGRPDPRLEALPPQGTSKVGFHVSEVGRLKHEEVLHHQVDRAVELAPCNVDLEIYEMAKKKKRWLSTLTDSLGVTKSSTAETAKAPAPSASVDISSGTATASKSLDIMAEPETLTSRSVLTTPSQSESRVEAESAASNALTELASPIAAPPESDSSRPAPKKTSARTALRTEISTNSVFLHDFRSGSTPLRPGKGMTAAIKTDEDGVEYLAIEDGALNAQSQGKTEGYSVKVPDEVESAASGKRIAVRAIARANGGGESRVGLAYSTNEVGNSGWRWFTVGAEWSAIAFEYDVPSMINGNGDFIGVLAVPSGMPGVDVCCVSVAIAPKTATA